MIWLVSLAFLCALGPALLFVRNLGELKPPPPSAANASAAVLIPARDEERNIATAVKAALESGAAEVIVLDDHSSDGTAEIVRQIARSDARARLISGQALPADWRGKNFACAQLADSTAQPVLIFLDADVQLAPGAAARLEAFLQESGAELASGVPRQITVTFSEQLLVPLIHFVLLGFLPLTRMRASQDPAYGTGCGQLFVAQRAAYRAGGGHAAIRGSVHDGLALPRNFRRRGFRTDLFDATDVATCRMYRSNREVWAGLTKNTHEGLGAPKVIGPMTLLLLLGQVAPFIFFFTSNSNAVRVVSALGIAFAFLPRLLAWRRFRQPLVAAVLHPLGISALVGLQWFGLIRHLLGRPAIWKGRAIFSSSKA
ncbi:MAG: glycosyltransferase [Chthoniobacterales bacterium]|nr:glycosyltransferase [Chthoniobacterales bacterium]